MPGAGKKNPRKIKAAEAPVGDGGSERGGGPEAAPEAQAPVEPKKWEKIYHPEYANIWAIRPAVGGVMLLFGYADPEEEEINTYNNLFLPNEVFNELAFVLYQRVNAAVQASGER